MTERIEKIKIDALIPFENHPFKERTGEEQAELVESIRTTGMLVPVIVRPLLRGKYEIISGHRRVAACRELGVDTIPAIVKELTKEEAVITMVDANLQRENLLPSEKAFAYKMKAAAMKAQGKRTDLTSSQVATKSDTATTIGQQLGEKATDYCPVRRFYLSLQEQIESELKHMTFEMLRKSGGADRIF